jgi:hypothetical protein
MVRQFFVSWSMADSGRGTLKMLRVMMTVDAIKQLDCHTEPEASHLSTRACISQVAAV